MPSSQKRQRNHSIQTLHRAAQLLYSFTAMDSEVGVTRLSERVGLHKSTVSRLLSALQAEGFVAQNPESGKYRLGLGLITLAGAALDRLDLRRLAAPHLTALAEATQETINLTILDGKECINIERIASPKTVRYVGWIGRRTPLHCTSTGKVFLAYLPVGERQRLLPEALLRFTKHTIVEYDVLEQVLAQVRQLGYAIAHEELEEGLSAVAAPICDHHANVVATVSISGPTFRMGDDAIEASIEGLKGAARAISSQLGYALAGQGVRDTAL